MALSSSGVFVNISSCTFTPSGGSATPIKGVKSISINPNVQTLKESADGDLFNTFVGVVGLDYVIDLQLIHKGTLDAVAPGTVGSLAFTLNDGRNAALTGGGAKTYTISNAVFEPQSINAAHRQAATNSYQFATYSTDGTTSPVAVAAV